MWGPTKSSKAGIDEDNISALEKTSSINEEYLHVFRTQSYMEFFTKAQQFINKEPSTSPQSNTLFEILLDPDQNIIPSLLEQNSSYLKPTLFHFFNASAQASKLCSKLLTSINEAQTNYKLIQRALQRFSLYSPQQYDSSILELDTFSRLKNPFSSPNPNKFKSICEEFSTIMCCLKSKRKKVASKFSKIIFFKCRSLPKLRRHIDVVAKGTYILNRDLDTISRIVVRLHDELEHKKEMIKFCLERKNDKFPLQEVVKEFRKNGSGFKWQVEELEEHVWLCLVTINKARASVIKEMPNS